MKIEGYTFSEELRYDLNNSYARQASDTEIVQGITDLGQAMVGEALYVEAPFVGRRVRQGERLLSIQPMDPRGKVIRLTAAVSGEIVAVNPALEGDPSVINEAPYDEGWLVVIRPDDVSEMSHLHSPDELPFRVWVSRRTGGRATPRGSGWPESLRRPGSLGGRSAGTSDEVRGHRCKIV